MIWKIYFIIFFLTIYTAESSVITGTVKDTANSNPLPGANIRIEGTGFGSVANAQGRFRINNVRAGRYNLLVSIVGYQLKRIPIRISDNDSLNLIINLTEQVLHTGEIVVSASKRVQAVQDVPISVSIIDSRSLQERNITKLDEALIYVPGISLNHDHVSIRGSSGFAFGTGSRVALLIDGFPLLSGDNGDIKFDVMPLFDIDRIEIIKGAGSALYGTSAIGGVINMITKDPTDVPQYHLRGFTGVYTKPRYQSWEYSSGLHTDKGIAGGYSQKFGDFGISLSGAWFGNQNYELYNDSYRWNTFTKMKYNFSENTDLSLTGLYATEDRADWVFWNSLDSATRPPTNANINNRFYSTKINAFSELHHIFNEQHFAMIRAGIFRTYFNNTLDPDSTNYRASFATSYNTEIQMNSRLNETALITYGLNGIYNSISSKTYGQNYQEIFSAYLQGETSLIPKFILTAGGRFDLEKTSNINSQPEFSPKIGLTYTSPFDVQFRASFGKGFRAPSIAERFAATGFQGFIVDSNLSLKPEISYSYEVGANMQRDVGKTTFIVDLSLFRNDFSDIIEPKIQVPNVTHIKFMNITRARILGLELDVKTLLFGIVGLESSLTAIDPRDLDSNRTLQYRSKFLWYSRLFLPIGPVELNMEYRYMSKFERIDDELRIAEKIEINGQKIVSDVDARVDAHVVDARVLLHLDKIINQPVTLTLSAKNLFDYYYTEIVANLAPTRLITLQLDYGL